MHDGIVLCERNLGAMSTQVSKRPGKWSGRETLSTTSTGKASGALGISEGRAAGPRIWLFDNLESRNVARESVLAGVKGSRKAVVVRRIGERVWSCPSLTSFLHRAS